MKFFFAIALLFAVSYAQEDFDCHVCHVVSTTVKGWAESDLPLEELKKNIDDFCGALPAGMTTICESISSKNIEEIALLVKDSSAEFACEHLGYCPMVKHTREVQEAQGFTCDICCFVVGACESWLANNETISLIEEKAHQVCLKMPEVYQALCVKYTDLVVTRLVDVMQSTKLPETVCKSIKLC